MKPNQSKTNPAKTLLIVITWTALTLFLYYYHLKVNISSDSTTMLPVARDLLGGNLLLRDWTLGTNNFIFTETIFYCVFRMLGCSWHFMIYVIPAAVISSFVVYSLYFFVCKDEKITLMCVVAGVFLGMVSKGAAYTLLNPNSHNNLYVFTAICITLILNYFGSGKRKFLVWYDILAVLMSFSESVTSMVLFAPVGLFCVYKMIFVRENRKKAGVLLVNSMGAYGVSKLVAKAVVLAGGVYTRGLPIRFVRPGEYAGRILGFSRQMLILFGVKMADPNTASLETMIYNVFVSIVLFSFIMIFLYDLFRFFRLSDIDQIFLLIVVVNLGLSVITDVVVYHRYIVPAFLFGVMLCSRTLIQCMDRMPFYKIFYGVLTIAVMFIFAVRVKDVMEMPKFGQEEKVVMEEISNRGWGDGYGDFWCASMPSFYSDFTTDIYPVYANEEGLYGYEELVKASWYKERDKHFIITFSRDASAFIDNERLFEILGRPDDSFVYGSYEVFYYDKDISDHVFWKGRD
jgi:hypothetical protein